MKRRRLPLFSAAPHTLSRFNPFTSNSGLTDIQSIHTRPQGRAKRKRTQSECQFLFLRNHTFEKKIHFLSVLHFDLAHLQVNVGVAHMNLHANGPDGHTGKANRGDDTEDRRNGKKKTNAANLTQCLESLRGLLVDHSSLNIDPLPLGDVIRKQNISFKSIYSVQNVSIPLVGAVTRGFVSEAVKHEVAAVEQRDEQVERRSGWRVEKMSDSFRGMFGDKLRRKKRTLTMPVEGRPS